MRGKLTLRLEDLSVDSFDTTKPQKAEGTVFGEQCTCWTQCTCPGCPTCANYNTCDASCNTCANTCPNTCAYTCDDATCAGCSGYTCDYSCNCNTWNPCPTALYTYCNGVQCY